MSQTRNPRPLHLALVLALLAPLPVAAAPAFPVRTPETLAQCEGMFASLRALEGKAEPERLHLAQAKPPKPAPKSEAELVAALSDMLQACSYDGSAIAVPASSLAGASSSDGEAVVKAIMRFTGLPQNFKVMEGPVPNAAALIVRGPDDLPMRVIAYNTAFLDQVRQATQNNDWASISIMAHEIGHHLSGHTLMPGGSQPPIELEADKFSGFVLQKMGAGLTDAQKAISTLVPEADGPTHPGRSRRLAAILDGWGEACQQQTGGPCDGTPVAVAAPPPATTQPAPKADASVAAPAETPVKQPATATASEHTALPQDLDGLTREELETMLLETMNRLSDPKADIDAVSRQIETLSAAIATAKSAPTPIRKPIEPVPGAQIDRLPQLAADSTPAKFDRFVYDELGLFDPEVKARLAKAAYDYAETNNIEIVTIIAGDLQGRSAEDYALDAMRQLRVGKLEVGNGAVLVFAPKADKVAVALGAGLLVEYKDTDHLRGELDRILQLLEWGAQPRISSELVADVAYRIMADTRYQEWAVRFQSLEEMIAAAEAADRERERTGAQFDPATDPTYNRLVRIEAAIVTLSPDRTDTVLDVNDVTEKLVGPAMHVRTDKGRDVIVYVNPNAARLMPVRLEEGRTYSFVLREGFLAGDTPQFDLVSYDLLN